MQISDHKQFFIKGFSSLLLLIIFGLIIASIPLSFYFVKSSRETNSQNKLNASLPSPQPDASTEEQISYEEIRYETPIFSLNYPKDYKVLSTVLKTEHQQFKGKDIYGTSLLQLIKNSEKLGPMNISISAAPSYYDFNLEVAYSDALKKAEEIKKDPNSAGKQIVEKMTVDGVDAFKVTQTRNPPESATQETINFGSKNFYYEIRRSTFGSENMPEVVEQKKQFDRIVETFKFKDSATY